MNNTLKAQFKIGLILSVVAVLIMVFKSCSEKPKNWSLIATKHNNAVENFFVYYWGKVEEAKVDSLARAIKNELCTKACNIAVYDDSTSYYLEQKMVSEKQAVSVHAYNGEISQAQFKNELLSIEKKYYVQVANHLVGHLDFSDEAYFMFYPYKDSKYKELQEPVQAQKTKTEQPGIGFVNFIGKNKEYIRNFWADKISSDFFSEGRWNGDGDEFFIIMVADAGTPDFSATFKNGLCYEHTYKLPRRDVSIVEARLKNAGYVYNESENSWNKKGLNDYWTIKPDVEYDEYLIECKRK
jgi:hypothetical protein